MSQTLTTIDAPQMTYDAIAAACVKKAHLTIPRMFLLACLAGIFLGYGCQFLIASTSSGTSAPELVLGAVCFCVGLIMIIIAGAELFTGNCLLLIAACSGGISMVEMLVDWLVVWIGNLVGSILVAGLIYGMGVGGYTYNEDLNSIGKRACAIAVKKAHTTSGEIFLRGIGANMLVCLAVIMAIASKTPSGKFLSVIFPVSAFVVMGFEHSIANMYYLAYATMLRCDAPHGHYWRNLILATLGNILGASFLALSYFYCFVVDHTGFNFHLVNAPPPEEWVAASPLGKKHRERGLPLPGSPSFAAQDAMYEGASPRSAPTLANPPVPQIKRQNTMPRAEDTTVAVTEPVQ